MLCNGKVSLHNSVFNTEMIITSKLETTLYYILYQHIQDLKPKGLKSTIEKLYGYHTIFLPKKASLIRLRTNNSHLDSAPWEYVLIKLMIKDLHVLVYCNMSLARPHLDIAAQILAPICLVCNKPATTQAF